MTQSITAKPKTVQEAIAYIQNHYPDADINEALVRQAIGLDEDAPDPPGLTEALEQLKERDTETEEEIECTPPPTKPQKLGEIVGLSDFQTNNIIENPFGGIPLSPRARELGNHLSYCNEEEYKKFLANLKSRLIPNSSEEKTLYDQVTKCKPSVYEEQPLKHLLEIMDRPRLDEPICFLQSDNHTITSKNTTLKEECQSNADKLDKRIFWAGEQQGERDGNEPEEYYITPELQNFMDDVSYYGGKVSKLWYVQGLSGSGKTSTQGILEDYLFNQDKTVIAWELTNGLSLAIVVHSLIPIMTDKMIQQITLKLTSYVPKEDRNKNYAPASLLEYYLKIVKPYQVNQALASEFKIWALVASKVDYLLIDFPDDNIDSQTKMNKRVDEIYELWKRLKVLAPGTKTTIVLFLQQETCEGNNHATLKKGTTFYLRPYKPEELTKYYNDNFNDYPFSPAALRLIASQCGGTPRRFKKMIEQCLNNYRRQSNLQAEITTDDVTKWIDPELFAADRELEFEHVFKSKQLQRKTAQIVSYLEQHNNEGFQADMTKLFFGEDETAEKESSRFFIILERKDYITSKFKDGKKVIKLKTSTS